MSSKSCERDTSFRPARLDDPLIAAWLAGGEGRFNSILRRADSRGKSWSQRMAYADVVKALEVIFNDDHPVVKAAILGNTHVFVYGVGPVWWDPETKWLLEQFFARLGPGDSDPLGAIDALAQHLGCKYIAFGTSLASQDEALGRYLEAGGYSQQSAHYVKETPWQSQQAQPC